jgi:hypothetical protein
VKNLGEKKVPCPVRQWEPHENLFFYFFTVAGINFVDLNYLHHPFHGLATKYAIVTLCKKIAIEFVLKNYPCAKAG